MAAIATGTFASEKKKKKGKKTGQRVRAIAATVVDTVESAAKERGALCVCVC